MKFFIDTANVDEIREANAMGIICGVTTNNYMGALQATTLLVQQMEERKKRKPVPLSEPIHKQITPVLIRWDTTS